MSSTLTSDAHAAACGIEVNRARCETCGEPARVRILEGYSNGQPIVHRFCLGCVGYAAPLSSRPRAGKPRLRMPVLVGLAGVVLGTVGVFGDAFILESNTGFGTYQQGGVVLGALLVFIGAVLRADVVALGGAFVFVGALTADWFGMARRPGIGSKQQIVLAMSLACVSYGVLGRFARPLVAGWTKRFMRGKRKVRSATEVWGEPGAPRVERTEATPVGSQS